MNYPLTPQLAKFSEWTKADVQQLKTEAYNRDLPLEVQVYCLRQLLAYNKELSLELKAVEDQLNSDFFSS